MERRDKTRKWRRFSVNFWIRGAEKQYRGFTANISIGGMLLHTHHLFPKETRIRAELGGRDYTSMVEGVVTRVFQSPHRALQGAQPSGMGVRFLEPRELVAELMPELGAAPLCAQRSDEGVFLFRFEDRQQFLKTYRDLTAGNLFIPSQELEPLHKLITVELSLAGADLEPIRFMAQVVHRHEREMPDGAAGDNLIAGMGVELLDYDATLKATRAAVAALEKQ